jgi:hypothetical protein
MTLVVANRFRDIISFSSDSRLSFGTAGHIDYCVKVFTVPVKIKSPTDSVTRAASIEYDHKLGLAVVGNFNNAYTVKESIYEILQNLQYIPGYTDVSMDSISKLVDKVFKKATKDLAPILQVRGLCQLILGGYCPKQDKIRVFEYSVNISDTLTPTLREILLCDEILFYGSGKSPAEQIKNQNSSMGPLHVLREVINSGAVQSVGGGLQYGEFVEKDFKIFGIEDYRLHSDGSFKEYLHTLRGLNIYKEEFERDSDGFHISYTFKQPFQNEVMKAATDYLKNN